jgi:hypothetical protein
MEKTKEKKEFNGKRIARQVEKSLKAVFPKEKFFVSEGHPVEVIYFDSNGCSLTELNMFKAIFCDLSKIKKEDLVIALAKKETAEKADKAPADKAGPALVK